MPPRPDGHVKQFSHTFTFGISRATLSNTLDPCLLGISFVIPFLQAAPSVAWTCCLELAGPAPPRSQMATMNIMPLTLLTPWTPLTPLTLLTPLTPLTTLTTLTSSRASRVRAETHVFTSSRASPQNLRTATAINVNIGPQIFSSITKLKSKRFYLLASAASVSTGCALSLVLPFL